ncbi:ABC transporter substrate-binding protein [Endozoicomonas sp. SM1973]|uniref:ABC transporter substrate-binding protein n=1 Tax=Spartinivicinus marinus TaxID=2994442 RepID=A0A853I044_9GAMM|nr:ABC transporter substrate-binding protein [Spartinivicinus marinus]MCX4025258.1 ABC transporter substrate-binding protein [Spartinivicinus marinus]NYZ65979.1 ABC transporter substrate-binding protein [Spartinivicinus marinus]
MKRGVTLMASVALAATMSFGAVAKTLKMAYDADPVSLDPHEQLSGGTLQLSHMVFDPLVRWDRNLKVEGRLAERWERIDDKTVRFFLHKGVKFHSGNELTALDVKWTFNRLRTSPDFKAIFAPFDAVKVVDKYTIDLVTAEPYPLTLNAATYIFPMDSKFYTGFDNNNKSKDALVKHGSSYASTHASGTGAFMVTKREQGVRVDFKRFDQYWDKKSPGNVKEIVLNPIKEAPTRVAALLSGDVDFIAPVPPTDLDRIKKDPKVDLVTISGTRIITFQLNQQRVEAFKNPKVRQAIVYAINNEGIAKKIMRGFATPAAQQSPKGYSGFNPNLKPRYDLNKAKQLMKEAGYEKGFSVTMMAPNNRYVNDAKIAQAAASMLAKINIKVDLKTMPKAQYWAEFDKRAADIMMIGWHSDTEDSANFTEFLLMCPDKETGFGQYNSGNYCNPEVDKLVIQSGKETDAAKRAAMLQKVEQMLYDDAAFVPLHWQDLAWAAKKNVKIDPIVNVMNFPYLGDLVIE